MNAVDQLPTLPGLAEPPTSEVRELSGREFLELCEQLKREGRFIAVLETTKSNRWRAVIRRLQASKTRTPWNTHPLKENALAPSPWREASILEACVIGPGPYPPRLRNLLMESQETGYERPPSVCMTACKIWKAPKRHRNQPADEIEPPTN